DDRVRVCFTWLRGGIKVTHFRQRLTRRVVIRHRLEQRTTKFADWLLRHLRQFLSVTQNNELLDATFEIGFGVPDNFCSLIAFGRDTHIERRRRRRGAKATCIGLAPSRSATAER